MYLLFREKNIMPLDYYCRPFGEKQIIRAFLTYELEEKARQYEEMNKNMKTP